MRGLCALVFFCLVLDGCGSSSDVVTDCYSVARYKRLTQPSFDLYVMNVKAGTASRIDLYVQMPYERLRFVKGTAGYDASYSVVFIFRGQNGESVQSKEAARTVHAATYDETVSLNTDAFLLSVTLPPGQYRLESTSVDQNSLVRYTQHSEVHAYAFPTDSVMASSILLLLKPPAGEHGTVLHPLFPQSIRLARDSMGIFQEIYGATRGDTLSIRMRYLTLSAELKQAPRAASTMVPPYSRYVGSCTRELDSVILSGRTDRVVAGDGTIPLIYFYPVPPAGYTGIERSVTVTHSGVMKKFISRIFLFKNAAPGPTGAELIDAMRYITRDDEFDSLRTSPDSIRAGVYERFWTDRGGAVRRAEFAHRVDEADKLFSVCTEGSRTPMGITYIVCGPPDYVECRGPYTETWYYTVGNQTMVVPFRLERRNEEAAFYELPVNSVDELLWRSYIDQWRKH